MKANVIEPGMILEGPHGQAREVVQIDGPKAQYRQVSRGRMPKGAIAQVGELRWMPTNALAFWALRDVTVIGVAA